MLESDIEEPTLLKVLIITGRGLSGSILGLSYRKTMNLKLMTIRFELSQALARTV
jgi:hypothetical protein